MSDAPKFRDMGDYSDVPDTFPADRVPSDDCTIELRGGKIIYPHRGQWVEVVRGSRSVQELKALISSKALDTQVRVLRSDMEDARLAWVAATESKDKPGIAHADALWQDAYDKRNALLLRDYDEVAEFVGDHIVDWNWTGRTGRLLPKPDGTIGPIQRLLPEELWYLQGVISDESPLNGSGETSDSPTTSSDTA